MAYLQASWLDPHCLQLPVLNSWPDAEIQGADSCGNSTGRRPHGPVLSRPFLRGALLTTSPHYPSFRPNNPTILSSQYEGGKPPHLGTPQEPLRTPEKTVCTPSWGPLGTFNLTCLKSPYSPTLPFCLYTHSARQVPSGALMRVSFNCHHKLVSVGKKGIVYIGSGCGHVWAGVCHS